jgi:hypothetical protein
MQAATLLQIPMSGTNGGTAVTAISAKSNTTKTYFDILVYAFFFK